MKSAARIGGHPIHPMLIPYPFAFLSGAVAFDAAALARNDEGYARTAQHLTNAGIVTALAAAVPGIIDYALRVPAGKPRRTATVHMLSNVSALACFAGAAFARRDAAPVSRTVLALEAIGTGLLSIGGWLGGSLTYHHQVGVDPEVDTRAELRGGPTEVGPYRNTGRDVSNR
ncbi:MAG TPA: DUF2231 domain-containing protein [Vicinamibacterales bacterium]|nr:DUF2231 domain-containing protein [Vicinamibacterales bacterium]